MRLKCSLVNKCLTSRPRFIVSCRSVPAVNRRFLLSSIGAWVLSPIKVKAEVEPINLNSGGVSARETASATSPSESQGVTDVVVPQATSVEVQPPPPPATATTAPLSPLELNEEATKRLMQEEEERRKSRRRKKGRIRELEEIRGELAEKELILLEKEQELLAKEQDVLVLQEELEIERKLRALLSKEKEKAEEEAALAMGLCTGGAMLP